METRGQHLIVDYFDCQSDKLSDLEFIKLTLYKAAEAFDATVVGEAFHRYSPQGASGILLVAESHISIHTWPEQQYAAVDIYTCGNGKPLLAHECIKIQIEAKQFEFAEIERGLSGDDKIRIPSKTRRSTRDKKKTRQIQMTPEDLEMDTVETLKS